MNRPALPLGLSGATGFPDGEAFVVEMGR